MTLCRIRKFRVIDVIPDDSGVITNAPWSSILNPVFILNNIPLTWFFIQCSRTFETPRRPYLKRPYLTRRDLKLLRKILKSWGDPNLGFFLGVIWGQNPKFLINL